ncbi:hypothetical protein RHMOL_Rhmol01G0373600 [Rhododendron molle]|uniref:Uncharacterized protein n=1 Tax=Rhododendron molle TaxID=49168 RepID=A0ACC0QBS3_RHOML|nr:hypothetical protein RHMOL_Rhmol01G0373600 [Rhododendron molle]
MWLEIGLAQEVGSQGLSSGLPIPSLELGHGLRAKALGSRLLEWGKPRQAGFTEQRPPPAPVGGRITGRYFSEPLMPPRPLSIQQPLFCQVFSLFPFLTVYVHLN